MKIIVEANSMGELLSMLEDLRGQTAKPEPETKPEPEPEPTAAKQEAGMYSSEKNELPPEEAEPAPKPKRKRRGKAQIEAEKLAEEGMTAEEAKRLWGVCAASNNVEVTDRTLRILDSLGVERPSELDEQGLLTFGREAKALLEQYPS